MRPTCKSSILSLAIIGSAEALSVFCVRCARGERKRERERERERDRRKWRHIVALKLAMSLHFPLQKFALFVSPSHFPSQHCGAENRNEFSLSVAKNFALFVPTLSSGRDCSSHRKMNQINSILKTIGNRKGDCAWSCSRDNTTWENLQIATQISVIHSAHSTDLCFAICRFSQVVFVPSNNFTHISFSISNSF